MLTVTQKMAFMAKSRYLSTLIANLEGQPNVTAANFTERYQTIDANSNTVTVEVLNALSARVRMFRSDSIHQFPRITAIAS